MRGWSKSTGVTGNCELFLLVKIELCLERREKDATTQPARQHL
jgi:hypothetical protein